MPTSITVRAGAVDAAQHAERGDGGEHEQAEPAVHRRGRAGQAAEQRRAERGVEAGQRPDREQHRRGDQHRAADRAGQPDLRDRAVPSAPGARVTVSGISATPTAWSAKHDQQRPGRSGGSAPGRNCTTRAESRAPAAGADAGGDGVGQRAAGPVDVEHAGADGADARRRWPAPGRPGRPAARARRRRGRRPPGRPPGRRSATSSTGRRPRWSDSWPKVSSAASTASA